MSNVPPRSCAGRGGRGGKGKKKATASDYESGSRGKPISLTTTKKKKGGGEEFSTASLCWVRSSDAGRGEEKKKKGKKRNPPSMKKRSPCPRPEGRGKRERGYGVPPPLQKRGNASVSSYRKKKRDYLFCALHGERGKKCSAISSKKADAPPITSMGGGKDLRWHGSALMEGGKKRKKKKRRGGGAA